MYIFKFIGIKLHVMPLVIFLKAIASVKMFTFSFLALIIGAFSLLDQSC